MAGVFGFSSDDAKRIGAVVRQVESSRGKTLGGVDATGAAVGARMMLAKRAAITWGKTSSAVVTAYGGSHPATVNVGTIMAWNYFADLPAPSTATQNWVALSNNGYGWIVIAAEC